MNWNEMDTFMSQLSHIEVYHKTLLNEIKSKGRVSMYILQ